jgi:TolB-like protein
VPPSAEPSCRAVRRPLRQSSPCVALLAAVSLGCSGPSTESLPAPSLQPSFTNRSHSQFPVPTIMSIFSFEDRTGKPELAWLRTGLVDMLIVELANNPSLTIVQRERVDEIIREQAFQLSGRVTDQSTVKVGRLIGANVLMTGRMNVVDGTLRLDAQIVGVEQGVVLGAVAAEGSFNDVAAVVRLLIAKLHALFPASPPGADAIDARQAGAEWLQTAKAVHDADRLSREGKLFEALEEYERALALDPANTIVQRRMTQTLERLPPMSWAGSEEAQPDRHRLSRILERLATGFEIDIGRPAISSPDSGQSGVRIPVRIRLSPVLLDQTLEALRQMKGATVQLSKEDETTAVRFADHAQGLDAVIRDRSLTRRLFLRLLSEDGRTIAVYSDFRRWSLSNWMTVDGATIRIRHGHVLTSEARFADMTPEQMAAIASVRVTIDRAIQEQAVVRLDVQMVSEPSGAKQSDRPLSETRFERHTRAIELDAAMVDRVSPLRGLMEAAWFPPVTVRPWSRGYVPSNERTAVVTLTFDAAQQRIREEPRLVRVSGETDFDRAALAAARAGAEQWQSRRGFESLSELLDLPSAGSGRPDGPLSSFKVRAQFRLRQDVPALNLIGPRALDRPFMPRRPDPAVREPVNASE